MATLLMKNKADFKRAKKLADSITSDYSTPPIPVHDIAEERDVDVVVTDFAQYGDSVAGLCDFNAQILYVNANDPFVRQTFTMAHELGHWLLHRDLFLENPEKYSVLPRFQDVAQSDPYEQEANCFAANLLVPFKLLEPVKNRPISWLAAVFGVSETMMGFRIKHA